jgi:hypothetical protein
MVQDIIAYLIIITAFGFMIFRIQQFFSLTGTKSTKCCGCATDCSLKKMHIANKVKLDKNDQYRFYL